MGRPRSTIFSSPRSRCMVIAPVYLARYAASKIVAADGSSAVFREWRSVSNAASRGLGTGVYSIGMTALERFYRFVDPPLDSGCQLWNGARDKDGYGRFWWNGRTGRACRFILEHKLGRVLDRSELPCHTCDIPGCVCPDHLFAGTQAVNIRDAWRKGRAKVNARPQPGERNGNVRLTEDQVREIRAVYVPGQAGRQSAVSLRALARRYGVSKFAITYALKGWRHLTDSETLKIP